VERMKQGTASAEDRQRLLALLEAEQAALEFLASWAPSPPRARGIVAHTARSQGACSGGAPARRSAVPSSRFITPPPGGRQGRGT
jgi:hypothetical protein